MIFISTLNITETAVQKYGSMKDALHIQTENLKLRDGKVYVVNKAGKAQATKVSGKEVNSYFIVDQGLVDSDKIVTNPDKDLKNNEQVENND